ncbi:MAG: hypothetical protein WC831_03800 [Parcubacteria group bacterium]
MVITHPDRFYEKGDPGLTEEGMKRLGEILVPLRIIIGTKFVHIAHGTGQRFLSVYKFFQEHLYGTTGGITRTASLFLGAPDANLKNSKDRILASGDFVQGNEYLGLTKSTCFSPWIHLWELLKIADSKLARVLLVFGGGEFTNHLLKDAGLIKELKSAEGQVYEVDFVKQLVRLTEVPKSAV